MLTTIELDMFSGRPNPTWTLTEAEVIQFADKLKELPEAQPATFPDRLGYRGFIVSMPGSSPATPITIKIYHTIVQRKDSTSTTYYTDSDRAIEQWLLQAAKAQIPDHTYVELLKSVERS